MQGGKTSVETLERRRLLTTALEPTADWLPTAVFGDGAGPVVVVDGNLHTLRPDVENIVASRCDDRFFGPTRSVFFDGGRGRDTYFRNWLAEDEVAFDGDRWLFVEEAGIRLRGRGGDWVEEAGTIDSAAGATAMFDVQPPVEVEPDGPAEWFYEQISARVV